MTAEATTLRIDSIIFPLYNPRPKESISKEALAELAQSIEANGVLQPILVRPADKDKFELVAGQRRLLATKLAGFEVIPAIIRELTTEEAREIAITENLQRADLHYLDEAKSFVHLLKLHNGDTVLVAKHLGKSEAYVAQRAVLVQLIPKYEKLARIGELTANGAIQLARLTEKNQKLLEREIGYITDRGDTVTSHKIRELCARHLYLPLEKAPFDVTDAELLKGQPACTSCPKSTGISPALFADLGKEAICTDGHCFRLKCSVVIDRVLKDPANKNAVKIVVGECWDRRDEIEKHKILIEAQWGPMRSGQYVPAKKKSPRCDSIVPAVICISEDPSQLGKVIDVCCDQHCPIHGSEKVTKDGIMPKAKREQIEALWQRRTARSCRMAIHAACTKKIETTAFEELPLDFWKFIASEITAWRPINQDGNALLIELYPAGGKQQLDFSKVIPEFNDRSLVAVFMLDYLVAQPVANKYDLNLGVIESAAKALGVDVKQITKPIIKEWTDKKNASYARRDQRLAKAREKAEGKSKSKKKGEVKDDRPDNSTAGKKSKRAGSKAAGKSKSAAQKRSN